MMGGAASYMIPHVMAKQTPVLVCSPHSPRSKEHIVFSDDTTDVRNVHAGNREGILLKIYRYLDSFQPDIVHIFQNPNCLYYLENLKGAFPKAKWVLDFRTQINSEDKKHVRTLRKRFFMAHLMADHIFSQSIHTIGSSLPLRLKPFRELPIGLDVEAFPAREKTESELRRFLFVGLIAKQRKLEVLIDAFNKYAVSADSEATLDLIGGGDALEELRNRQSILGTNSVRFIGPLSQSELGQRMSQYDAGIAYVPGGAYQWAPSLKSLEYSAAGLSVFASATKGHRDYQKRFGFDFELFPNTEDGLVNALVHARNSKNWSTSIARNKEAVLRFDWKEIIAKDLVPVYEKILKR